MASKKNSVLLKIQNRIEYILIRAVVGFLRLLPWRVAKAISQGLFVLIGYHIGVRRKVAETQMRKVYPDWSNSQIRKTLKQLYRNMGLSIATIYLIPEKRFIQNCKVVNRQYVDEAYSHGKGVILATAHLGNWEAARVFPLQEMPTSVIVRQQRNIYFDQFNNAIRSKHGVGMIDMKRGLRDIVAAFRKNEMVAILMDQNAGKSGLIMDFLGFPASHWLGVAKLSLRYKVPILPGFALLNPDGTTEFTFQPIIYHPDWEDDESLYPVLLKEVNEVIERFIHQYPSQWFWVHKRWKATGVMNE